MLNLSANTEYVARLLVNDAVLDEVHTLRFKTLPLPGTPSITRLSFGSCLLPWWWRGLAGFSAFKNVSSDLVVFLGDFIYADHPMWLGGSVSVRVLLEETQSIAFPYSHIRRTILTTARHSMIHTFKMLQAVYQHSICVRSYYTANLYSNTNVPKDDDHEWVDNFYAGVGPDDVRASTALLCLFISCCHSSLTANLSNIRQFTKTP
mgnify:CR=1 FL=1